MLRLWQKSRNTKSLTCSSCRTKYIPTKYNDKVVLFCNNCNTTTDEWPEHVGDVDIFNAMG